MKSLYRRRLHMCGAIKRKVAWEINIVYSITRPKNEHAVAVNGSSNRAWLWFVGYVLCSNIITPGLSARVLEM